MQRKKSFGKSFTGIAGAFIGRKRFSIAAHYRNVKENDAFSVALAVDAVAARHRELRRMDGKKVHELLPDIDWDKGKAVLWLLETLELERGKVLPIYIGDDRTDEDAFSALEKRGVGILVSEQPQVTAASYWLHNPEEVEEFLQKITDRLHATECKVHRLNSGRRCACPTTHAQSAVSGNWTEPQKEYFSKCTR